MDIVKYLKSNKVKFQLRHHPARFTAQEVAAAEHITGEEVAKTVVVKAGDRFAMFVLPATHVLEMAKVRKLLGAAGARLATEDEMGRLFPDTQVGAEPPFGSEYGLDTYRRGTPCGRRGDPHPRRHARGLGPDGVEGLRAAGPAQGGLVRVAHGVKGL